MTALKFGARFIPITGLHRGGGAAFPTTLTAPPGGPAAGDRGRPGVVAGRIVPAEPVDSAGPTTDNSRLASAEGYPSGQRGQTVNLLAMPS